MNAYFGVVAMSSEYTLPFVEQFGVSTSTVHFAGATILLLVSGIELSLRRNTRSSES